jgi:hypothetical protein
VKKKGEGERERGGGLAGVVVLLPIYFGARSTTNFIACGMLLSALHFAQGPIVVGYEVMIALVMAFVPAPPRAPETETKAAGKKK